MSDFLRRLPHAIPFRAASAETERQEGRIAGNFLWTANDLMPPELMLVEAMAQLGGSLVLESQGYLSGIDSCSLDRHVQPGDLVGIEVHLEASLGRLFRFRAVAMCDGVEIGRARFYLASAGESV